MKFLLVLYIGTTFCNKIPQSFGFKTYSCSSYIKKKASVETQRCWLEAFSLPTLRGTHGSSPSSIWFFIYQSADVLIKGKWRSTLNYLNNNKNILQGLNHIPSYETICWKLRNVSVINFVNRVAFIFWMWIHLTWGRRAWGIVNRGIFSMLKGLLIDRFS